MKKSKRIIAIIMLFIAMFAGCSPKVDNTAKTRVFVDDIGREIEIPLNIKKVIPTGQMAQIVLYSACPNLLIANSSNYSKNLKDKILSYNYNLPSVGQFYGKNVSFNLEEVLSLNPDIIIDIGEKKKGIKEDIEKLQKQIGKPVVFIENTLEKTVETFIRLQELLEIDLSEIIKYSDDAVKLAIENKKKIEQTKKIYIAMGDKGLHTNGKGSMHSQIIDLVGGDNVADIGLSSSGTGSEVSFEQVLLWQPEIIVVDGINAYNEIKSNKMWKSIKAVKDEKVFLIPDVPYSYVSRPPSVNRLIGIYYLGQILYPELYQNKLEEEIATFNKLFYHYN